MSSSAFSGWILELEQEETKFPGFIFEIICCPTCVQVKSAVQGPAVSVKAVSGAQAGDSSHLLAVSGEFHHFTRQRPRNLDPKASRKL